MPGVTLHAKAGPAQEFGQVRVDSGPVVIPELTSRLVGGQAGQAVLISRSAWPRVGQAARCFRPRAASTRSVLLGKPAPARLRLLLRQRVRPIRAQQLTGPRSGQPNGRIDVQRRGHLIG